MNFVEIYTDGSCKGNPGPGGWAAVIKRGKKKKRISGFVKATTNNRMELMAAVKALESLQKATKVKLFSDSNYLVNGMNKWLTNWKKRYWKTAGRKPVKNMGLWQSLDKLNQKHDVSWNWVKAHDSQIINEECDTIAKLEIEANLEKDNSSLDAEE